MIEQRILVFGSLLGSTSLEIVCRNLKHNRKEENADDVEQVAVSTIYRGVLRGERLV